MSGLTPINVQDRVRDIAERSRPGNGNSSKLLAVRESHNKN